MMANTSINRMLQMCPAFTSFKSASSAVWLVARFMWSAMRSLHSVRCGSIAKHSRTGQSLGWRKTWMHNENTSRAGLTASEPVLPHDERGRTSTGTIKLAVWLPGFMPLATQHNYALPPPLCCVASHQTQCATVLELIGPGSKSQAASSLLALTRVLKMA